MKNIKSKQRLQHLAGIKVLNENFLPENESPDLTNEEKQHLEGKIEEFLNDSLFNSDILSDDSEDFNPIKEERAIQFIIDTLKERIQQ